MSGQQAVPRGERASHGSSRGLDALQNGGDGQRWAAWRGGVHSGTVASARASLAALRERESQVTTNYRASGVPDGRVCACHTAQETMNGCENKK